MKVEVKESLSRFDYLKSGDVFRFGQVIYMKIETVTHNEDRHCNAVILSGGYPVSFEADSAVDTLQEVTLKANNINRQ